MEIAQAVTDVDLDADHQLKVDWWVNVSPSTASAAGREEIANRKPPHPNEGFELFQNNDGKSATQEKKPL